MLHDIEQLSRIGPFSFERLAKMRVVCYGLLQGMFSALVGTYLRDPLVPAEPLSGLTTTTGAQCRITLTFGFCDKVLLELRDSPKFEVKSEYYIKHNTFLTLRVTICLAHIIFENVQNMVCKPAPVFRLPPPQKQLAEPLGRLHNHWRAATRDR